MGRTPTPALGKELFNDVVVIVLVSLVVYAIAQLGILAGLFQLLEGHTTIAAFIAGMFFTSAFTITPAAVVLAHILETAPLQHIALIGALGGVVGDLVIFSVLKKTIVTPSLRSIARSRVRRRVTSIFNNGLFKWVAPAVGALIIASPLPDELGLALMGISRTRIWLIAGIAFVMNFLGILALGALVTVV